MSRQDKKKLKEMKDLNISINEFGKIVKNKTTKELNDFLNEAVNDKKLAERDNSQEKSK